MAKKIKYNYDLLKNIIDEYNAKLIENYEGKKLNRDSIIKGKCSSKDCNNFFSKSFRFLNENAGPFCVECSKKVGQEKLKKTILENYGVDHPCKSKDIIKKRGETNLKKYGETCSLRGKEAIKKTKLTIIKIYGVENVSQSSEIWDKIKKSNNDKYGTDYGFQCDSVKKKIVETNIKKYGGVRPNQNPEIMEKSSKNSYSRKKYVSPTGKIFICQGYEPQTLNYLINIDKIDENDIINGETNVPKIEYFDDNNKKHIHYPDIFIKSKNLIIETKSSWTIKKKENYVFAKQKAAKEQGYLYEIWVMNKKGDILEKHI